MRIHITNGDNAGAIIQHVVGDEPVLPWRDVLHEGPIPAGLSLPELSAVRAEFIVRCGWGTRDEVFAHFRSRDAVLLELGPTAQVTAVVRARPVRPAAAFAGAGFFRRCWGGWATLVPRSSRPLPRRHVDRRNGRDAGRWSPGAPGTADPRSHRLAGVARADPGGAGRDRKGHARPSCRSWPQHWSGSLPSCRGRERGSPARKSSSSTRSRGAKAPWAASTRRCRLGNGRSSWATCRFFAGSSGSVRAITRSSPASRRRASEHRASDRACAMRPSPSPRPGERYWRVRPIGCACGRRSAGWAGPSSSLTRFGASIRRRWR